MSTAAQLDGLAGALLRCVEEPERIPIIQVLLDRYSHRLRNRLNSMKLSLYLARRLSGNPSGPEWVRADSAYRSMEAMIEQVQLFCNPLQPSPAEGDLNHWIEQRVPDWHRLLAERSLRLETSGPGATLPSRFDWNRLAQGLDALISFWSSQGPPEGTIRLSWQRLPGQFHIRFESESSLIRTQGDAENLALPVLARVLRAHQGRLDIAPDASAIELTWPAD
ncbi:sensor histidine kinase [Tautonia rosea]|uniref:sensor histidine kinase n=1 Tax=Tautonia rosea TaxID=2728037 RepID=UPI001474D11C|nr:HAMP domain-containing histidine kinase [Tautonia rosea]